MADKDTIDLKAVLDRFNSSQATLNALGEKLRSLTLAEETASQAASSLTSASESTARAASALTELVSAASAAQTTLQEAVQAASDFVGATDLAELTGSIRDLDDNLSKKVQASQKAVLDRHVATQKESSKRLDKLEEELIGSIAYIQQSLETRDGQLDAIQSSLDELRSAITQQLSEKDAELNAAKNVLARVRTELSSRQLSKLGLDGD